MSLLFAAIYYSVLNHTGRIPTVLATLYHVPHAFARVLMVITVALVGLNWSLGVRPLTRNHKVSLWMCLC